MKKGFLAKLMGLVIGMSLTFGSVAITSTNKHINQVSAAGPISFVAGTDTADTSVTKSGITVTTSTMSRTDNYRVYANDDITVSSTVGNITLVEFTCTANGTNSNGPGKLSLKSGSTGNYTYQSSGKLGSWEGNAESFTLTASTQCRITKIDVTYSAATLNPSVTLSSSEISLKTTESNGKTVTASVVDVEEPTYLWTTTNSNILLENTSSATVTVKPNSDAIGSATVNLEVGGVTPTLTASFSVSIRLPNGPGESAATAYTVSDAISALEITKDINDAYVSGIICKIDSFSSGSITYWLSDDGAQDSKLEVYLGKGLDGANFSSISDIKLGSKVVIGGDLTKYSSTIYEFKSGSKQISNIELSSIAVKTAPSKISYEEGESFNPNGLVLVGTYSDESTKDFSYTVLGSIIEFNPTTSTALSNETSVSITLFGCVTSQNISVTARTITSVSITGDMTNKTYVKNCSWNFAGLSLSISYNTGSPTVIELSTLTVGTDFNVDHANADGCTALTISGSYNEVNFNKTINDIQYVSNVTFTAGTDMGTSGASNNADTISKYGITVFGTNMATTTAQYRVYKNCVLTISSDGENIRKIEFVDSGDSSNPASNLSLTSEQGSYSDLIWAGNSSEVEFSASAQARLNAIKVTTDSGVQPINGLVVDGTEATVGQVFNVEVSKGSTKQLNVSVSPAETSDSKTINYEVVSGEGATVNSSGLISATTTIGATARIKATSAANSSFYVFFDVTVVDSKKIFDFGFSCSSSSTAFDSIEWNKAVNGDGKELTYDSSSKLYPDSNCIKFGSSSSVGSVTLTIPNDVTIKEVILEVKAYSGDDPTISVNSGTDQEPTSDWSYLVFDLATASSSINIAGTNGSKGRFYIRNIVLVADSETAAIGAFAYSADLMNSLSAECAAQSVNATTWATLGTKWLTTETNYEGANAYMSAKTASENGNLVEKALARYDYVVGKYNKTQGLTAYNDFMDRNPAAIGGSAKNIILNNDENSSLFIMIAVLSITTLAGASLFIRKRKEA